MDQLNVSITTNRTCNLKCKHCYIEPEEFKNKTQMTKEIFMEIFARVEDLVKIDRSIKVVEWELIGGEPTMMPYEFWEEMLPFAIERCTYMNETYGLRGDVNFVSNLMFRDKRYAELLSKAGQENNFFLYFSWEPDTGRYGTNNKLEPKFLENLSKINAKNITLGSVFTRGVINMGAKAIMDKFRPYGITDSSIEMLSPLGSGKKFFEENDVKFNEITNFYRELKSLKLRDMQCTPFEEMQNAFDRGAPLQCDGNYKYDLCIEPDGYTHFDSSRAGVEIIPSSQRVAIFDPQWAVKVAYESKEEMYKKITIRQPKCVQCKYLRYCNAGWHHYKDDELDLSDIHNRTGDDECSGTKRLWELIEEDFENPNGKDKFSVANFNHLTAMTSITLNKEVRVVKKEIRESDYMASDYEKFLGDCLTADEVYVDRGFFMGKSLNERLFFYNDIDIVIRMDESQLTPVNGIEVFLEHYVNGNYGNKFKLDSQLIWDLTFSLDDCDYKRCMVSALNACLPLLDKEGTKVDLPDFRKFVVDERNDELFRWILCNKPNFDHIPLVKHECGHLPYYLEKLASRVGMEKMMRGEF